jgi:hypothetical protein
MKQNNLEIFQDALTAIFFACLCPFAFVTLLNLLNEKV